MILLLDMDGVLVDLIGGMQKRIRELEQLEVPYPDEFKFEKAWDGLVKPEVIESIMQEKGFFLNLEPMPGAIEACKIIQNMPGVDFHVCTSPKRNSTYCVGEKWEWIKHYLGSVWTDTFAGIHDKTLMYGDVLVDDQPIKTGRVEPDWFHILYDHPYNKHIDRPRITWQDWPNLFLYWKEHEENKGNR